MNPLNLYPINITNIEEEEKMFCGTRVCHGNDIQNKHVYKLPTLELTDFSLSLNT